MTAKRQIIIDYTLEEEHNYKTTNELYEHLQDWLSITKLNGEIKNFHLSLRFPKEDSTSSQKCPVCNKLIGHSKAIEKHRTMAGH